MASPKSYFHDHYVLFLLTVNGFLALLAAIVVVLRLSSGNVNSYIVEYRSSLGVSAFKTGSITELLSFSIFALVILAVNVILSIKMYTIQRNLAVGILSLGILLSVLDIIVSNSLLVLR